VILFIDWSSFGWAVRSNMGSLSNIRVNTDELRSNSSSLKTGRASLAGIIGRLVSSVSSISAGKYGGQLEAKVVTLLSHATTRSASLQNQMSSLSGELDARAGAFDAANNPLGQLLFGPEGTLANSELLVLFTALAGLETGAANFVFSLTGFGENVVGRLTGVIPAPSAIGAGSESTSYLESQFSQLTLNQKFAKLDSLSAEIDGIKSSTNPDTQKLSGLEAERSTLQNIVSKEGPQPHTNLNNANPSDYTSCATYAQARRVDLATIPTSDPRIWKDTSYPNVAAANYKNMPGTFQLSSVTNQSDLRSVVAPGNAIVWDKGILPGDGFNDGHIAIVEMVNKDRIVVSQANWPGHPTMGLTTDELRKTGLYIVP
jgi:surface antigen